MTHPRPRPPAPTPTPTPHTDRPQAPLVELPPVNVLLVPQGGMWRIGWVGGWWFGLTTFTALQGGRGVSPSNRLRNSPTACPTAQSRQSLSAGARGGVDTHTA